jgi:hypothetical protein
MTLRVLRVLWRLGRCEVCTYVDFTRDCKPLILNAQSLEGILRILVPLIGGEFVETFSLASVF